MLIFLIGVAVGWFIGRDGCLGVIAGALLLLVVASGIFHMLSNLCAPW